MHNYINRRKYMEKYKPSQHVFFVFFNALVYYCFLTAITMNLL